MRPASTGEPNRSWVRINAQDFVANGSVQSGRVADHGARGGAGAPQDEERNNECASRPEPQTVRIRAKVAAEIEALLPSGLEVGAANDNRVPASEGAGKKPLTIRERVLRRFEMPVADEPGGATRCASA